jgi:hypothetical protein
MGEALSAAQGGQRGFPMGVGSIKGGGGRGGPRGVGGPSGKGAAGKAGSFGAVDGAKGPAPSGGPDAILGPSVIEEAAHIAKALRSGEIPSKQEAARQLVAAILKHKLDLKSKALASRIADQLQEDPRLSQTLERIWQKG